ncbi:MAG TPA: patatin family protein [Methanocorpusculum sp.]|nr:patatin family protein [Methanocorpusculum sp.]
MYQAAAVFEGGGMRGGYSTGVIDVFLEHEIEFSSIYAVSAGACHAASFVSKQHNRAYRISTNYLHDKSYCSLKSLITTGNLFGTEMLFYRLHNELDPFDYDTFAAYKGTFYATATNLSTGEAEYFPVTAEDSHNGFPPVHASSSMPLLAKNVRIGKYEYLDGCIADSIPVRRAISDGNKKVVLILTRPADYRKGKNLVMPLYKMRYHEYPNFLARCADRNIRYNETMDFIQKEEEAGNIFVIRPDSPLPVGVVTKSKEKLKELYDIGHNDAEKKLDELLSYLKK